MAVGQSATIPVKLESLGKLPNLLALVTGEKADGNGAPIPGTGQANMGNILRMTMSVTATRLADGTVNGVVNACRFSYTMSRPMLLVNPAILFTPYDPSNPATKPTINVTDPSLESAVLSVVEMVGPTLQYIAAPERLSYEPYLPVIKGTFATSNTVPFVPISLDLQHIYGVSGPSLQVYNFSSGPIGQGQTNIEKALTPVTPVAHQTYTYVP
jgi:hypothetical protein